MPAPNRRSARAVSFEGIRPERTIDVQSRLDRSETLPRDSTPMMPRLLPAALALALASTAFAADEPFNTKVLRERLAARPTGAAALALENDVMKWIGGSTVPKIEGLDVTWTYRASGRPGFERVVDTVRVVSDDKSFSLPLVRIGETESFVGTVHLPEGRSFAWHLETDGKPLGLGAPQPQVIRPPPQLEVYTTDPDSLPNPNVPKGTLTQMPKWQSTIFAGTTRDWWVYVPAQYTPEKPACVMIFQDGAGYKDFVPTVFDNLIAKGDMPTTVGIFINPGAFGVGRPNRSFEYDTLSDQYARFLLEEILPEVEKTTKLRHDPASRAVAGISSGGICAWTVAWERPQEFRKVLSWVGSFTNIASGKTGREGGHNYEALVRKTPKKPIRVFLQDGSSDLDNANGNWPLANQTLAKSLAYAGYDYKFVFGEGFHSNKHGRAILPDSLRWLWRDFKP
jgi:enterochelin esterase-like enzyme